MGDRKSLSFLHFFIRPTTKRCFIVLCLNGKKVLGLLRDNKEQFCSFCYAAKIGFNYLSSDGGGSTFGGISRSRVGFHGRAGANQIAVPVNVVDSADTRPNLRIRSHKRLKINK